ncbi:MAG TPA: nickel pincer cofactor biosynthesis protein LarC [Polyangiales bacterium]
MSERYAGFRPVAGGEAGQSVLRPGGPANGPLARDAGRGRILYLDAGSGIAGDMLMAALLDLGVPLAVIESGLSGVDLRGYNVRVQPVERSSIRALHVEVVVDSPQPARDYTAIVKLLHQASSLTDGARQLALAAFGRLAQAEAQIHGVPIEQVHFHEVGAIDSIVDVVACAVALDHLGAQVRCSPLPMGRGFTRSAHGMIPLPAPATLLCLQDIPTYDAGSSEELVTPTGACLVASAATDFGGWPRMRPERAGFGAGTKEFPDRPNVLRIVLGMPEPGTEQAPRNSGSHVLVETNVDDMSGELAAYALTRLLEVGALDAWTTPIGMKKGRPAIMISALAQRDKLQALATCMLTETTSLGVRYSHVDRIERPRRSVTVDTAFGAIAVKVADGDGLPEQAAPEYESCRRAAHSHQVPIREVYAAALTAYLTAARRS